jgi:Na+/proline symporter
VLKLSSVSTLVGYGISGFMAVIGVLVLSGLLVKEGMPMQLRILFGLVLVLYSVYRFMMTRTRAKQTESPDE